MQVDRGGIYSREIRTSSSCGRPEKKPKKGFQLLWKTSPWSFSFDDPGGRGWHLAVFAPSAVVFFFFGSLDLFGTCSKEPSTMGFAHGAGGIPEGLRFTDDFKSTTGHDFGMMRNENMKGKRVMKKL